ncbi:MAG: hypothetical protein ACRD2I_26105 [Vicinamibacterales bacterium]
MQELARLHSGAVSVESVAGQGSTFRVTIPTGKAHLPADRVSASRVLAPTAGALSAKTRGRALESVERNARIQAQLVDDLLDVSRIVSGKLEMKSGSVDLGAVIEAAVETVRLSALAKHVTVTSTIEPDDILVKGDRRPPM